MVQKKRALLIAISYRELTGYELAYSHVYCDNLYFFLVKHMGWKPANIRVMKDDNSIGPRYRPTRENIMRELIKLSNKTKEGDLSIVYFTGLGSRIDDKDGDDSDGKDDVLVPIDYQSAGFIIDDDLRIKVLSPLPVNSKMLLIFDTCRGRMLADLCRVYKVYQETNTNIISISPQLTRRSSAPVLVASRPVSLLQSHDNSHQPLAANICALTIYNGTETDDEPNGYLTAALISVLRSNNDLSFCSLLSKIRDDFDQRRLINVHPCFAVSKKDDSICLTRVMDFF